MERLISLTSHVAVLCVTWFDFVVFPLKELSMLSLWHLWVALKRTFYHFWNRWRCLVMHMFYCPLVGEPISSLDMVKIEILRLHTNHPRWESQLLNCKLRSGFNAANLGTTLGKARVEVMCSLVHIWLR